MSAARRYRVGLDVRSPELGAAAVFAAAVDWDDTSGLMPGLAGVLSSLVWEEGEDTRWWLGVVVEAASAAEAAQQAAGVAGERLGGLLSTTVSVHAAPSAGDADEELDGGAISSLEAPAIVPVPAAACSRSGDRLTIEWFSGLEPLAHVSVAIADALVIGLAERRPSLSGPEEAGEALVRRHRHVVVRLPDAPEDLPIIDRYSGGQLPEGTSHLEDDAIQPVPRNAR